MGLKEVLRRGKLQKVEREARKLHGLQRRYRRFLDDLEEERKRGLAKEKYEERKAKLEAKRHELIEKLKQVEEQERQLRAELAGKKASV